MLSTGSWVDRLASLRFPSRHLATKQEKVQFWLGEQVNGKDPGLNKLHVLRPVPLAHHLCLVAQLCRLVHTIELIQDEYFQQHRRFVVWIRLQGVIDGFQSTLIL